MTLNFFDRRFLLNERYFQARVRLSDGVDGAVLKELKTQIALSLDFFTGVLNEMMDVYYAEGLVLTSEELEKKFASYEKDFQRRLSVFTNGLNSLIRDVLSFENEHAGRINHELDEQMGTASPIGRKGYFLINRLEGILHWLLCMQGDTNRAVENKKS